MSRIRYSTACSPSWADYGIHQPFHLIDRVEIGGGVELALAAREEGDAGHGGRHAATQRLYRSQADFRVGRLRDLKVGYGSFEQLVIVRRQTLKTIVSSRASDSLQIFRSGPKQIFAGIRYLLGRALSGRHHVRLEQRALEVDVVVGERLVHEREHLLRHLREIILYSAQDPSFIQPVKPYDH